MTWGVGAFIVTFAVLWFFLGAPNTNSEFLVTVAISAIMGVAAGLWLGRKRSRPSGDPGEFDERATRRAVRRGVVRTALVVVVWLFFGTLALGFASALWQQRGGREHHLGLVVEHGLASSLPGWRLNGVYCCNAGIRSLEVVAGGNPISASPLNANQSLDLRLHINLRGRLTESNPLAHLPATGVDAAFSSGYITDAQLRAKLAQLPHGVVATAIVELRNPTPVTAFYRLLARHRIVYPDTSDTPVFLQAGYLGSGTQSGGQGDQLVSTGSGLTHRVSWPSPAVAGFQDWVKQLHSSDDGLLHDLGLPGVATLRALATRPRVYGFVLSQADPKELLGFLADPHVAAVRVGDIAYNLTPSS
jgi:hypothetical protein